MAECAVMYVSIITGINLVYHEYCIITWHRNHFQDLFILADNDNPLSYTLYQTIRQIAKKLLLKGGKFVLGWLVGVSTLHAHAWSTNLTIRTLISSVTHVI